MKRLISAKDVEDAAAKGESCWSTTTPSSPHRRAISLASAGFFSSARTRSPRRHRPRRPTSRSRRAGAP